MKNQSLILKDFVEELELTVLSDEKAYLLEGMVGTCAGSDNCQCNGNNCQCESGDNCQCEGCNNCQCESNNCQCYSDNCQCRKG